jgi:hypothetical protein
MKDDKSWSEAELKDLILFAQSLREENEELRAKVIAMDAMVNKREAALRQAQRYIMVLEEKVAESGFGYINMN